MDEALLGYPLHKWLAIGHMAEAESELLDGYFVLANIVREHRKAYEEDSGYSVPILQLIREIGDGPEVPST
jgi:hypothetical protein